MHTDQIYIARDGKSGMHVLVRILAVDDIGVDYPPIDPDNFNKLMMARDVRSLVLAARDLGPMYISTDILSRRIFIPSHLQQHIGHGVNLVPSDLESLLSECYFDPYAFPVETDDMGYRAIGRTGKKSTRELIDDLDFTKAGDLSYLDSQFRAIVEPLHDWVFARNLLSILMRIGGLYRSGSPSNSASAIRKPSRMCGNMPPWISRSWKYPSQMISQMRGIPERAWQNELQEPAMRRVSPVANGSTLLQLKRFSSVAGISRQNHPINRSAIKEQIS